MKRITSLLFAIVIFLSACASPAASTSAPAVKIESTSTAQPAAITPVENTAAAAFTPAPTPTPTPVPPPPRWYWGVDADTLKVLAVNQLGEQRELGALEKSDDLHTVSISLYNERALLFLDANNTLRVFLLTPAGMQKIKLPSEPLYFNTDFSQASRAVVGMYGNSAVFTYSTTNSSNFMPETGPIFLVDLTSFTAKLIDKAANQFGYGDKSYWFHTSQDGQYLRYLNGDQEKMELRELDMVSGDVRTLYTTSGSSFNIRASPQGDLWYLRDSNIILDLNGNQTDFKDDTQVIRPLKDGKAMVFPRECVDTCEIKVITPFGKDAELTYNFPWVIQSAFYSTVSQLLPDQSFLFVGEPYAYLTAKPAAMESYPELTGEDSPLFRLTPDGQARLVGILAGQASADRRYLLLRSTDQSSFFIYDAIADRPLFDMPVDTELADFLSNARFFDDGILVDLNAAVPDGKNNYRFFYYAYFYETSTHLTWEDVDGEFNGCPDLLNDKTLICWIYKPNSDGSDLVRFDPATGIKTALLENSWLIDLTP